VQLILKDGLFFLPLITKYKQALATLVELDENEEEELKEDQEEADSFWPKLQDLPKLVLYAHAENDFEYQERVFLDSGKYLHHTLDALGVVSYHNKENSDYLL